jgi:hypothetical protein
VALLSFAWTTMLQERAWDKLGRVVSIDALMSDALVPVGSR